MDGGGWSKDRRQSSGSRLGSSLATEWYWSATWEVGTPVSNEWIMVVDRIYNMTL